MSEVLFTVRATIAPAREAEFNRWYSEEHSPQMLEVPGCVRARRYRAFLGDRVEYMAVYEFTDRESFEAFDGSEKWHALRAEYDEAFGDASDRSRAAYELVWSSS
jgi:antibiotic biosynthesis monooxygenase (ABM) superfamily enzyme